MTTVLINGKTEIGKNILKMLKNLAEIENENSIKFLDKTNYLRPTEANKKVLVHRIGQVKEGAKGKTIKPEDLWK